MAAPDPLLGSDIGRYRVIRMIGKGGMGAVYEGLNPEIGSRVAIKVLAPQYATDPESCERMFAEARAANMVRHPRVVSAIDMMRLGDGRPVIVMELVDGVSLRDALGGQPAALGGIVDVILQVLDVLAAAHAAGIVHRDLKPDNILITPAGEIRVLDFGIAKLMAHAAPPNAPRTRTGVVLGTPEYMAPEHISGGVVDERVDLYALGVILFEGIIGRRPFEGATDFDVMRAHVDSPPPSARALRPDVPIGLDHVIEIALAKHPRDRFASALAMSNALRAATHALPSQARRSLTPSHAVLVPATAPNGPSPGGSLPTAPNGPSPGGSLPTVRAGRLDVATARAKPDNAVSAPVARLAARGRWLVPAVSSVVTGGAVAIAFALHASNKPPPNDAPKLDAPKLATLSATDAPAIAARMPTDAPAIAARMPTDAPAIAAPIAAPIAVPIGPADTRAVAANVPVRRASPVAAEPTPTPTATDRDDVFSFQDADGLETCLRQEGISVTIGTLTRALTTSEIAARCIDTASRLAAHGSMQATMSLVSTAQHVGIPSTSALGLLDVAVHKSPSVACNDLTLYRMLVEVFDDRATVAHRYMAHAKAIVVTCLNDATFRKDFVDELHSSDEGLRISACEILTAQKLVQSCP